jgi:hypothetical protein
VLSATRGRGLLHVIVVVTLLGWPPTVRLVSTSTLRPSNSISSLLPARSAGPQRVVRLPVGYAGAPLLNEAILTCAAVRLHRRPVER